MIKHIPMRRVLSFCINYNIIVSFASLALYKVTEILFNFNNPHLSLFIFSSTLFAYNYMRIPVVINLFQGDIYMNTKKYLNNYLILLLAMFFMWYSTTFLGIKFIKLIIPVILISLIYPIKFYATKKEYSFRGIPFVKIFTIAFTWAYITLLAPILYYDITIDYYVLDFWFQRVLFVLAISIPFDIRDFDVDMIQTLPNTIGIYESKIFAWFCLLIIDLLLLIDVISGIVSIPIFIAFFLCIEICSAIIYFSHQKQSFVFYGLIVESLSIIMCLFVLVASFF